MENNTTFKLSNEEAKKLNYILPKGYKFVLREEIIKKDVSKPAKKPRGIQSQTVAPTAPAIIPKTKSEKIKDDEF